MEWCSSFVSRHSKAATSLPSGTALPISARIRPPGTSTSILVSWVRIHTKWSKVHVQMQGFRNGTYRWIFLYEALTCPSLSTITCVLNSRPGALSPASSWKPPKDSHMPDSLARSQYLAKIGPSKGSAMDADSPSLSPMKEKHSGRKSMLTPRDSACWKKDWTMHASRERSVTWMNPITDARVSWSHILARRHGADLGEIFAGFEVLLQISTCGHLADSHAPRGNPRLSAWIRPFLGYLLVGWSVHVLRYVNCSRKSPNRGASRNGYEHHWETPVMMTTSSPCAQSKF